MGDTGMRFQVTAKVYEFSHDVNGNPTAHFVLTKTDPEGSEEILFQTRRRVQTGYSDNRLDGAHAKLLGMWPRPEVSLLLCRGSRAEGECYGLFQVETFPTVNAGGRVYRRKMPPAHYVRLEAEAPTTRGVQAQLRNWNQPGAVLYGGFIWGEKR